MQNSKIFQMMARHGYTESTNRLYTKRLLELQQNEWIYVDNKAFEHYSICDWFASVGLICKKIIPQYSKTGSYLGNTIYFYWNESLNYSKL